MKNFEIIVCALAVFCSLQVSAQKDNDSNFSNLSQIGATNLFLLSEDTSQGLNPLQGLHQNALLVNQVGQNNSVEIKKGASDTQQVYQYGKNNYYNFIDYYNTSPTNFDILQKGNANSLQIYGTNSFMENIKIVQKSSYKSITIKNY